jgi:hypothetical protein
MKLGVAVTCRKTAVTRPGRQLTGTPLTQGS